MSRLFVRMNEVYIAPFKKDVIFGVNRIDPRDTASFDRVFARTNTARPTIRKDGEYSLWFHLLKGGTIKCIFQYPCGKRSYHESDIELFPHEIEPLKSQFDKELKKNGFESEDDFWKKIQATITTDVAVNY